MALVEEGLCRIEFINKNGLGCGKTAAGVVEVPYALINEIVTFERHEYRGQSNCLLKSIEKSSNHRIAPECKYFGRCGGCMLQHMDEKTYNSFKISLIKNILPDDIKINPIITIPKGNRRRINLKAVKKDDRMLLGFYRFHSHQIIDIDSCPAMMRELSDIVAPLKEALINFLENRQKAEIFLTHASNGIDILIDLGDFTSISSAQELTLINFAKNSDIIRLKCTFAKKTKLLFESEKPYILLGNKKVAIDAECFMQASFASDKILADLAYQYFPSKNCELVDLFCGRGTLTLPLSKNFNVTGFESDSSALNALENASEGKIALYKRDLFAKPLTKNELDSYRYVVINPPRAGALAQAKELARSNCERIVYVSCNPESFTRDAAILQKGGYKLLEVTPVDQFYWSPHLELVGVFEHKQ